MTTRLEVVVPKSDTHRVLKTMTAKLTEMGVKLIPFHRGSVDVPHRQESLIYCEVPDDFVQTQDVTNALYANHSISPENVVRKKTLK